MKPTPSQRRAEENGQRTRFRREARERWSLASPFRQGLYIAARLRGLPPGLAILQARGPLR